MHISRILLFTPFAYLTHFILMALSSVAQLENKTAHCIANTPWNSRLCICRKCRFTRSQKRELFFSTASSHFNVNNVLRGQIVQTDMVLFIHGKIFIATNYKMYGSKGLEQWISSFTVLHPFYAAKMQSRGRVVRASDIFFYSYAIKIEGDWSPQKVTFLTFPTSRLQPYLNRAFVSVTIHCVPCEY